MRSHPFSICLALFFAPALVVRAASDAPRPNVLLIVADDLGYGELGCYGGREIPTPHLDALAREGVRFTHGYVTASFCAPSRAALLTGRYQTRFGYEKNPTGAANADPRIGVPVSQRTLADHLRGAGYATGLVGKWHLGGTAPFHPYRRGFDEFFGFLHEGHYYVSPPWQGVMTWLRRTALPDGRKGRWTSPDGRITWTTHMGNSEPDYDADNPILRGSQPVSEKENLTDAFTREACDFIRRYEKQPFFLYLAYNAVHSPLQAADAYLAKFQHIPDLHRRIFAALLSHLDDGVGRVLQQLKASGLEKNTLVIFLADNGGATRELTSSNAPLRGEKGSLFEGGLRVPFIVRWPQHLPRGAVWDRPVISMDGTVTALAAAGIAIDPKQFDGVDLRRTLQAGAADAATEERAFYWRQGPRRALRQGPWKLVGEAVRGEPGPWQLYNLAEDVAERHDLAAREPARVQALRERYEAWSAAQAASLW